MASITIPDATLAKLRDAVYEAYEFGELSDEDYSDAIMTLKGIPRDAACPRRFAHLHPSHVCDPDGTPSVAIFYVPEEPDEQGKAGS